MHVLHVGADPTEVGGMQSVVAAHLRLSLEPGGPSSVSHVTSQSQHSQTASVELLPRALFRLLRSCWDRRAEGDFVVHVHLSERGSYVREGFLVRIANAAQVPVVVTNHGAQFAKFAEAHARLSRWVLGSATIVHALGSRSAKELGPFVDVERTAIAPNWVDVPDRVTPAGAQHPVVLFGGVNGVRKGLDVLLEAWPLVMSRVPEAELRVAGPPGDVPLVQQAGVRFLGSLGRASMMEQLGQCRLAVLPSRAEVMPMFLLEASARGRPCVATDVGDVRDIVDPSGIVPIDDEVALADALVELLESAPLCTARGEEARRRAWQRFSTPKAVVAYTQMYATATAHRALSRPSRMRLRPTSNELPKS